MPTVAIVALPEEDELVWDLSSETKPHMTLLVLGESLGSEEQNILEFVQHAASTSLSRFGLSVDRRGTLGDNNADVLFFDTEYGIPELRKFRAQLLKNDFIFKNYVKEDQFPGWIPHLTMGFPDSPAKKVPDGKEYGLKWINFDRIAVWIDDYEGPEFDLRKHNMAQVEDAFWSEAHGAYLMHYGKNGMKVAVRKPKEPAPTEEIGDQTEEPAPPEEVDPVKKLLAKVKHGGLDSADEFLAHDILGMTDEEYLEHYGRLGMRWGVRRQVGSDGRVVGPAPGSKTGQEHRSDRATEALAKVRSGGKVSSDHKALVKNLDKKVEQLSTDEIRQITKRIEAVHKFNAVTAAQKAAKRNFLSKTLRWAVGSAHKGAQEFGEQYIKNLVKTNLKGVVPEPQDLFKKGDKEDVPSEQKKPTPVFSTVDNTPQPSKQLALEDLATVLARIDKEED